MQTIQAIPLDFPLIFRILWRMRDKCITTQSTTCINEALQKAFPYLDGEEIRRARDVLIQALGGGNIYIPKQGPLNVLARNIDIIRALPPAGSFCSKAEVYSLARKYNLSMSQVYRIRREAQNTYLKIEELYDHEIITESQHAELIEVLQQKLPSGLLGKPLD